uniref:Uncharacterized protein n=1 Tax=Leptobrachium leishanense TaxID=445787 RepID=A0A8C5R8W3_9ANUR
MGARLEEKRRAIEAQKKRIEAIFTKHRQQLGRDAFRNLTKKDGLEEGRGSHRGRDGSETSGSFRETTKKG